MSRIVTCLDCPMYQTGGRCRHKKKDVGALQPACDYALTINDKFNPEDKTDTMHDMNTAKTDILPETPQTKLCKKCGKVLPLEAFGKKKGTKDGLQNWCKPCTTKQVCDARRARKAAQNEPKGEPAKSTQPVIQPTPEPIREPISNPVTAVLEIPDYLLAGELRRRGWDVKATRTTIEEL